MSRCYSRYSLVMAGDPETRSMCNPAQRTLLSPACDAFSIRTPVDETNVCEKPVSALLKDTLVGPIPDLPRRAPVHVSFTHRTLVGAIARALHPAISYVMLMPSLSEIPAVALCDLCCIMSLGAVDRFCCPLAESHLGREHTCSPLLYNASL